MKPKTEFTGLSLEFWANIKLISQKLGYTNRTTKKIKTHNLREILEVYEKIGINSNNLHNSFSPTEMCSKITDYFEHRADFLNNHVEPNLMNKDSARVLFDQLKKDLNPKCPLPLNKQKGDKRTHAYFTGIINMLIEANSHGLECDYDPKQLTILTVNGIPMRVLSRRVDGAFPSINNPVALWEIKEYYSTTTFGSRVADGVYETILDGMELKEARENLNVNVSHYLMVDDYYTWWTLGRSYLCRICDILHMGLISEALFGKEVVDRIPHLVKKWVNIVT